MRFIAEELREYMAKLGVKTVDELVEEQISLKQKLTFMEVEEHQRLIFLISLIILILRKQLLSGMIRRMCLISSLVRQ